MSIRRRIAAVERGTGPQALDRDLVSFAAFVGCWDGVFWPDRDFQPGRLAALDDLRIQALASGIAWQGSSGGGTGLANKRDQLERSALVAAGFVVRAGEFLRPDFGAMERLRVTMGLATLASWPTRLAMVRIALSRTTPPTEAGHTRPGGWVSECHVFDTGHKTSSRDWFEFHDWLLPALSAGVCESRTTTGYSIYFRLVAELPASPAPVPFAVSDSQAVELLNTYDRHHGNQLENLTRLTGDGAAVGIPLSATA